MRDSSRSATTSPDAADGSPLAGDPASRAGGGDLEEVLAEGDRALLFTQFCVRHCCERIRDRFGRGPLSPAEPGDRSRRDGRPVSGGGSILILSLKLGTGLSHRGQPRDPPIGGGTPRSNQATDRAYRIGSTGSQVHELVCAGTLERIAALLRRRCGACRRDRRDMADGALHRRAARPGRALGRRRGGGLTMPFGRRRRSSYSWDPPYQPARPPRPVKDGLQAKSQRGAIGETWWSRRFIEVLEDFHEGPRLARGRAYARRGQVMDMDVEAGEVRARVELTGTPLQRQHRRDGSRRRRLDTRRGRWRESCVRPGSRARCRTRSGAPFAATGGALGRGLDTDFPVGLEPLQTSRPSTTSSPNRPGRSHLRVARRHASASCELRALRA